MGHWLLDVEVRVQRGLADYDLARFREALDAKLGTTGAAATYNDMTHDLLISCWLAADGAADAMVDGRSAMEAAAEAINIRVNEWLSIGAEPLTADAIH